MTSIRSSGSTDRLSNPAENAGLRGHVDPALIVRVTCSVMNIPMPDVFSSCRHLNVMLCRGVCAAICRDLTDASYPEISRAMGKSCPSGVRVARERVRRLGYDYSMVREEVKLRIGLTQSQPIDRTDALRDEVRLTHGEQAHVERDRAAVLDAIERAEFWKAWLAHKESRHAKTA
jgi:hypothetical protein